MRLRALHAIIWVSTLTAQDLPLTDPTLAAIHSKVAEQVLRLPDFVCAQTVERAERPSSSQEFRPLDTLRLEVALIGGRERYAWAGARQFDDRELRDLAGRGMTGTGNFALHARHVFEPRIARFQPRGAVTHLDRPALRYDYEVPWENSAYRIGNPPKEEVVGFRGSLLVDAGTLELLRLEVVADEIAPELGLDRVSTVLDYAPVTIGAWAGLLPKSSELIMVGVNGVQSRNRTTLGPCREYRTESKLILDGPPDRITPADPQPPAVPPDPPGRRVMELSLDAEIALETAAAGDPIRAVLVRPLKDGERLLAPEGAVALGRVVRREKQGQPFDRYEIALEFHTLEIGPRRLECVATLMDAGPAPGLIRQAKRMNPTFTRDRKPRMEILVNEVQRGQGVLLWEARRPRIRKSLRMRWLVEDLRDIKGE
jgi:hypothetical protein